MPGYGIHSEDEGMLAWEWVEERMAASRNYWICTTRPDARPHAAPVWRAWVDGTLYFGSGPNSRKARNLARNPNVAVHLESGDEAVILEGVAEAIADPAPDLASRTAEALAAKYVDPQTGEPFRPESIEGFHAIRPTVALAWRERDFPASATRWRFGG